MPTAPPGHTAHNKEGHGPTHHAPHPPHPVRRRKRRSRRALTLWLSLAALGVAALWMVAGTSEPKLSPEQRLVEQMHLAVSGGAVPATHALGGKLTVIRGERGMSVQAENLESKACVSVGYRLAPDGIVTVNGSTPARLSAAKLSELCAQGENGLSVLSWTPRD